MSVVVAGDFNSTPGSAAIRLALTGRCSLDARFRAALLCGADDDDQPATAANDDAKGTSSSLAEPATPQHPHVKQQRSVLVDANLNRLCRWLRLCGVDAALESEQAVRGAFRN